MYSMVCFILIYIYIYTGTPVCRMPYGRPKDTANSVYTVYSLNNRYKTRSRVSGGTTDLKLLDYDHTWTKEAKCDHRSQYIYRILQD